MKFSVGLEYALHCLLYMVDLPEGYSVGVCASWHTIRVYQKRIWQNFLQNCAKPALSRLRLV